MVNANGNRCAGTCRNHLPVAREDAVQLIKSSPDMKVKCGNILLPLRGESSAGEKRGGGGRERASLTVRVKREISLLTDPTKAGSKCRDGDEKNS